MKYDMEGKVALVTGASLGIGRAAALAFARQGASVVLCGRREAAGREVMETLQAEGRPALWVSADVSDSRQVQGLIERVVDQFGRLDYAFNNAGSGGRGGLTADIREEDWDLTINGYLKSVWLCMKYQIPVMLSQNSGAIVNNSSVDGKRAFPYDPIYSIAKHGILGLTKSAALQYATRGLRINAVCPGWIDTPGIADILAEPGGLEMMLQHQPAGRLGRAEEVAAAVVWLCSEEASFVLGTALDVDGGYLAV
jgi:NAD(P)-dependent dehydrogenase (short-subunit alcohol dehydrogenase family)